MHICWLTSPLSPMNKENVLQKRHERVYFALNIHQAGSLYQSTRILSVLARFVMLSCQSSTSFPIKKSLRGFQRLAQYALNLISVIDSHRSGMRHIPGSLINLEFCKYSYMEHHQNSQEICKYRQVCGHIIAEYHSPSKGIFGWRMHLGVQNSSRKIRWAKSKVQKSHGWQMSNGHGPCMMLDVGDTRRSLSVLLCH